MKVIIVLLVFSCHIKTFLKSYRLHKLVIIWKTTFQNTYAGFRKGLSTQYCLLHMIEIMKSALDNRECCGILFTDLSKAFDCVKHDLLIAKMHAYNFDHNALALIYSYLSESKQRTKINSSFSSWHDIYMLGFHKDLTWDRYCSTFILMIYFTL